MSKPKKDKFKGLGERQRLQNSNLGDLSANLRPRQRELAEIKRKAGVAAQAKKPFNPGRSAVADSFGPTPAGKRLSPGLIGKLKKRALKKRALNGGRESPPAKITRPRIYDGSPGTRPERPVIDHKPAAPSSFQIDPDAPLGINSPGRSPGGRPQQSSVEEARKRRKSWQGGHSNPGRKYY